MPEGRPAIPAALQRELLEEAGHRCAIPTCRVPGPLQFAHITPWTKVREHRFENMIVLCNNDHFRFDSGQIAHQSMRAYKANLAVLNGRYSDVERRLLEHFADTGLDSSIEIDDGEFVTLSLRNLIRDGLVDAFRPPQPGIIARRPDGTMKARGGWVVYTLTDPGRDFVKRWIGAESLLTIEP